jgi:hypothetical protein
MVRQLLLQPPKGVHARGGRARLLMMWLLLLLLMCVLLQWRRDVAQAPRTRAAHRHRHRHRHRHLHWWWRLLRLRLWCGLRRGLRLQLRRGPHKWLLLLDGRLLWRGLTWRQHLGDRRERPTVTVIIVVIVVSVVVVVVLLVVLLSARHGRARTLANGYMAGPRTTAGAPCTDNGHNPLWRRLVVPQRLLLL